MDKSNFVHFVNSVRWQCNHFVNIARFNEDIDRTVRVVCDIRPEYEKCNLCRIRNFSSKPSGLVVFKN